MAGEAVPHVLVFPFPAQGHVRAMMKLAELLSSTDLYVTFVNTEHIHRRLEDSFTDIARPRFRFLTIPDGLPVDDTRSLTRFAEIRESLGRSREQYRELLAPGKDRDEWPPVMCVLADSLAPLAWSEVAEEMRIPVMFVLTSGPASTLAYFSIPNLIEQGEIPLAEEADMDELVQGIPGMESFLRRRDLPSFLRDTTSVDDPLLQFRSKMCSKLARGIALILNTVESIDSLVLLHLRSFCPVIYSLGPIQTLLNNITGNNNNNGVSSSSNSANIWQEDKSCITWLDSQPERSVIYVSFGSITVVSKDTLLEFWHGLVSSGRRFLWVIRPDMVEDGASLSDMVPPELIEERGRVVAWAPQEEVLAHRAVGCFLTHSGWNSTLESMVAGVPMICWPYFADQQINSRFVSEVWKIGVDMKDLSGRSIVERMVREVMDGERAEELKRTASDMADAVRRSCEPGGSSYRNFKNFVDHIKSLKATDA